MSAAQPARRAENVIDLHDGIVEGEAWPRVPDAEYLATYQGHECVELKQFRNAPKLFVRVRLFDASEHTGKVLFRSYRVRRRIDGKRFVVGPKSDLVKMVRHVGNHRTRPDRISLRDLKNCLLRVRTRTVTTDADRRPLPEALMYSVVADILGQETL